MMVDVRIVEALTTTCERLIDQYPIYRVMEELADAIRKTKTPPRGVDWDRTIKDLENISRRHWKKGHS